MKRKRLKPRVPQLRILPYKMGSKSAGALAEGLRMEGQKCFKVFPNKGYIPRPLHTIINWGSGDAPNWNTEEVGRVLNHPYYVRGASNKLTAFNMMKEAGVSIPEFTTSLQEAMGWAHTQTVVARRVLQGHSGAGISIIEPEQDRNGEYDRGMYNRVPLFVKYIKKSKEYRVHVFNGTVIDVQMKRKRQETPNEEVDYQVRNHANGWVYCRDNLDVPPSVHSDATSAVAALGLDFGAVDIIWNEHQRKSFVLECNTAPGLVGTTLSKYVEAIKQVIGE